MNAASLHDRYQQTRSQLPSHVQLVVVSKTHPVEKIEELYRLGHRSFGENKVQEMVDKQAKLPADIQWHLIGHLQTNKVKQIAGFVHMIESVDSEKVLKEIDKQAKKYHRTIKVLLQVKIAAEDTKFGLEISEAKELFLKWIQGHFPNIEISGLMGMATFTDDDAQIRNEFNSLKQLFEQLSVQKKLNTLSMGMSGDYTVAIECGSNSVRIGSAIFGERDAL